MIRPIIIVIVVCLGTAWTQDDDAEGRKFIEDLNKKADELAHEITLREWALVTDEGGNNKEQLQKEFDSMVEEFNSLTLGENVEKIKQLNQKGFSDEKFKRMVVSLSDFGDDLLPEDEKNKLKELEENIQKTGLDVRVQEFNAPDGAPGLDYSQTVKKMFENYKHADQLTHYWKEWFDKAGKPQKDLFTEWIRIKTLSAETNGYKNILEYWEHLNEVEDYESTFIPLVEAIQPLFKELHAYIRHKLSLIYGSDVVDLNGPIPHSLILQDWDDLPPSIMNELLPFPGKQKWNIDSALQSKNIQGKAMAETLDNFYQSLGFEKLPESLYEKSYFEKKGDMSCQPSAYDFADKQDYRFILCSDPTENGFNDAITTVTRMEWKIAYKNLPQYFKRMPSDSFRDAVFAAMSKFVNSPKYLKSLGLLEDTFNLDKELEINILLQDAIYIVFDTPFALSYDLWRWRVIKGEITPDNYNCEFWNIRRQYQGVEPPIDWDKNGFGPGGFATNTLKGDQMIERVMGRFMKYGIIKSLCETAGYQRDENPENDLAFCDISNNKEAGAKVKEAMELGQSEPLFEILGKITGQNRLDASGLIEYFKPLEEWLIQYNNDNHLGRGWPDLKHSCQ